jgi:hypothetical protein
VSESSSRLPSRRRPSRRPRKVEGNDVLYHFLQKTLLESDYDQFRELSARMVSALGVWLPPLVYARFPILVPYAVRDPACRGNRSKGEPDEWGSPSAAGLFRDDNSLIKGLPRSLAIENRSNPLLHRRVMGTSFVASHVWRELAGGGHASRDVRTYSFVPNLVWLPSQVSKLTDREGSFVQSYLQALSTRIYSELELAPKLERIVRPIWRELTVRQELAGLPLPDPAELNYFEDNDAWAARRAQTLRLVIRGLVESENGGSPSRKIISTRYTDGLPGLSATARESLSTWLETYADAVDEAAVTAPVLARRHDGLRASRSDHTCA